MQIKKSFQMKKFRENDQQIKKINIDRKNLQFLSVLRIRKNIFRIRIQNFLPLGF
jgi:hypothetical protein